MFLNGSKDLMKVRRFLPFQHFFSENRPFQFYKLYEKPHKNDHEPANLVHLMKVPKKLLCC